MRRRIIASLKRHEIFVVAAVIGVVFLSAMGVVAWLLQSSIAATPYEAMSSSDLNRVFATAYVRFREDDKTSYLKVELHNGTLWWIKKVEFDFDGIRYTLKDSDAFRPLHLGAVRCTLRKPPSGTEQKEYDLTILKGYGYPPAHLQWQPDPKRIARALKNRNLDD